MSTANMYASRTCLIIAAHPDDEILGVGGTAARHVRNGGRVEVLIVAEGATSRTASRDTAASAGELDALRSAARLAAAELGTQPPRFLGLPDNRLDSLDLLDLVKAIDAVVHEVQPDVVYTHHAGDLNIDHGLVQRAVLTACRPLPSSTIRAIYGFETVSSTEWGRGEAFVPSRYVAVRDEMPAKMAALRHYKDEMRPFPNARSLEAVEALARVRGAQAGVMAAEAFTVLLEVER
jgi:N-acetylglucosamine malate deacetylase 1